MTKFKRGDRVRLKAWSGKSESNGWTMIPKFHTDADLSRTYTVLESNFSGESEYFYVGNEQLKPITFADQGLWWPALCADLAVEPKTVDQNDPITLLYARRL